MRRFHVSALLLVLLCFSAFFCLRSPSGMKGRQLVWSDEFNGAGLPDPAKWGYNVGGHGWGNRELQYYTDADPDNARVEDGKLIVEARKETFGDNAYTSARLVSRTKGEWTYGRVEARAKLPERPGHLARHLDAAHRGKMKWPDDGEIDIMEYVGFNPGVVHGTVTPRHITTPSARRRAGR
jgi:beta-glucanase (GH16 family)